MTRNLLLAAPIGTFTNYLNSFVKAIMMRHTDCKGSAILSIKVNTNADPLPTPMLHLICDSMTRASDNNEPLGLPHGFTVLVHPLVLLLVCAY